MQQASTGESWLVEMVNAVIRENGSIMEYKHLIADPKTRATWQRSCGNEVGRLAQGMPGRVEGTNTIFFIEKSNIPVDCRGDVTYVSFRCNYRPQKEEKEKTRMHWWQSNKVSWRCRSTHSQPPHHKVASKQCRINKERKNANNGPERLLSSTPQWNSQDTYKSR